MIIEAVVDYAALVWLESLGSTVNHRLEIAPGEVTAAASLSGS